MNNVYLCLDSQILFLKSFGFTIICFSLECSGLCFQGTWRCALWILKFKASFILGKISWIMLFKYLFCFTASSVSSIIWIFDFLFLEFHMNISFPHIYFFPFFKNSLWFFSLFFFTSHTSLYYIFHGGLFLPEYLLIMLKQSRILWSLPPHNVLCLLLSVENFSQGISLIREMWKQRKTVKGD